MKFNRCEQRLLRVSVCLRHMVPENSAIEIRKDGRERRERKRTRHLSFVSPRSPYVDAYEETSAIYVRRRSICRRDGIYYFSIGFTQKALRAVYLT